MEYKRSSPEEIDKRNAKAYLGTEVNQKEDMVLLKNWLKKKNTEAV